MVALGFLIIGPCLLYSWVVMRTAQEMRIQRTQDRNLMMAQLTARLLDEQYDTALTVYKLGKTQEWLRRTAG